jgi:type I restriction enzyme S subunit
MNNPRSSRPLSELVDPERGISYGIVQPGEECIDGIPIIRVTDIREGRISTEAPLRVRSEIESKYVRTRLRGGELLLTLVGTVGETAIVPPELAGWNTARAVGVLPICKEPGARWVHYVLRSRDVQALIREWCNTTVQATLNLRDVARLPIIVPPLQERRAIEEILFALDDKIELNRQISRTLETMVKALFKSWFIDFDPIRAKTDSCGQMDIVAAALALFPSTLCEDHLGLIPKGWQRGTFGDIAEAPRRGVHPADVEPTMAYIGLDSRSTSTSQDP